MRLLVLGASGGCGRWVTRLAAGSGHVVTAFVRPGTPYEPPRGVRVLHGNALDPDDLAPAVAAQDAVISCIGPQRVNPRNPWSPLRPPPGCAESSAQAVVTALGDSGIRFAAISAAGVAESIDLANGPIRWLIRHSTVGAMYADLEAMEQVLARSSLDWVTVRPVTLVNARPSSRARGLTRYRALSIISRADVARWLLASVEDRGPIVDRTPMVGWW